MKLTIAKWGLGLGAAIALSGCATLANEAGAEQPLAGWYLEHAEQGLFQRCGESRQWRVSGSSELRTRARKFGLERDTPVYVRVVGVPSEADKVLTVSRVEQFGSATPVRNCGLTGVVTPPAQGK